MACQSNGHYTRSTTSSGGATSGGRVGQEDLLDLQSRCNDAVNLLTQFYTGSANEEDVLEGVTQAMRALAGHRENVRKSDAPGLGLFEGSGDE